jgi:hypothetical protein
MTFIVQAGKKEYLMGGLSFDLYERFIKNQSTDILDVYPYVL